ncbi:unnamed protein product, partial [Prorocentrum cordatum]
ALPNGLLARSHRYAGGGPQPASAPPAKQLQTPRPAHPRHGTPAARMRPPAAALAAPAAHPGPAGRRFDSPRQCALAIELRQKRRWEQVLAALHDLVLSNLQPELVTCGAAISTCSACSQWQHVFALLDSLAECGIQKDVILINAAISACSGEQWDKALWLLRSMDPIMPNTVSFSAAVNAISVGGSSAKWEHTLGLLSDMCSLAIEFDMIAYGTLVGAFFRQGTAVAALAAASGQHA